MQTKPTIVFCHGLWADGSCFSKLIVPLQADGFFPGIPSLMSKPRFTIHTSRSRR